MTRFLMAVFVIGLLAYGGWRVVDGLINGVGIARRQDPVIGRQAFAEEEASRKPAVVPTDETNPANDPGGVGSLLD